MEEQKRDEERRKSREKEKKAAALASLTPVPDASAQPQKSILKNKSSQPPYVQKLPPSFHATPKEIEEPPGQDEAEAAESIDQNNEPTQQNVDADDQSSALPEGFFDDPVLDAKVCLTLKLSMSHQNFILSHLSGAKCSVCRRCGGRMG